MIRYRMLSALSMQLSLSSMVCVAYNLVFQAAQNSFFPIVLLVYSPLMVILNDLFLRKERSIRVLIIFNTSLILAMGIVVFFVHREKALFWRVMACPFLIFFSASSVEFCTKPISYGALLRTFDVSILVFLLTCGYISMHSLQESMIFPAIVGASISLFTVIFLRQLGDGNRRSWLVTIFCAFFVFLLILIMLGYAPVAGGGLVRVWNWLVHICELISVFFNWLFSLLPQLFPVSGGDLIPLVTDDPYRTKGLVSGTLSDHMLEIIVIVVGSIVGFFVLLYFVKGLHLERRKRHSTLQKRRIHSVRFFSGISRAIRQFVLNIEGRIYIARNKGNALGLYFWMIRMLRNDEWEKKPAETPRCFLLRLEASLSAMGMAFEFAPVASSLELLFYSPDSPEPIQVANAPTIRKGLRHVLFIRRMERVLEKMKKVVRLRRVSASLSDI